ncbi:MAG: methyltransferase domain-containing protein [Flavobacterium sp.]|nr:methyltransferase domain-containing protein [Pedobacter sp.]
MDVFGKALLDYYRNKSVATLWLHNNYAEVEEMPVDLFFRKETEMPEMELVALNHCKGKILDIGAGAGSHALALQIRGFDVSALDCSAKACRIMRNRGIHKVINDTILKFSDKKYDTLIMLMNGIGLTQNIDGLKQFLLKAKDMLHPGGQLIFDSSNISYLYEGIAFPEGKYYGEISYRYEYKSQLGNWFSWLYIDKFLLEKIAVELGWEMNTLFEDNLDQYLIKLTIIE